MSKKNRTKSIGIFDSGFGGLTIMKKIVRELPDYDFVYLGDTARVPYGTRSGETVRLFMNQAIKFLLDQQCGLIVIACNTASSELPQPPNQSETITDVIIPTAKYAASKTKNGIIGVMATPRTITSGAFKKELLKINSSLKVVEQASPLLVPLIEAGEHTSKAADLILRAYLKPLMEKNIDTLILGCTHYGILEPQIKKIVGSRVRIVSEGPVIAKDLRTYLKDDPEIDQMLLKNKRRTFYSTDLTDTFKRLGSKFFGESIPVKKATLSE